MARKEVAVQNINQTMMNLDELDKIHEADQVILGDGEVISKPLCNQRPKYLFTPKLLCHYIPTKQPIQSFGAKCHLVPQ